MLTLKEFVLKLNKDTHFRVFLPNRDCLIYESFHIPHVTDSGILSVIWNEDSYLNSIRNQQYVDVKLRVDENSLDYETKIFLEKYGEYEIFSIDCSSCCNSWATYNECTDKWDINYVFREPDYNDCFDLFIKYPERS